MKRLFLGLLTVVWLSGCAVTNVKFVERNIISVKQSEFERPVYWPEVKVQTITQLGEAMIRAYKAAAIPAIDLQTQVRHVTPYSAAQLMFFEIEPATLELIGNDAFGGQFFAAARGVRYAYQKKLGGGFDPFDTMLGGLHVSRDGQQSMYWTWSGDPASLAITSPLTTNVPLTNALNERPARETKLRRELVYSGMAKGSLSILYREYIGDMIRPAFSQELKYDYEPGTVIGFRGARFEVLEAGNTSIRYRVIEPLSFSTN